MPARGFLASNPKVSCTKFKSLLAVDKAGAPLAHDANAKLVGKNMAELKDAEGKPFIKPMIETASGSAGKGWVDAKTTYYEAFGGYVFCAGVCR